MIDNGETRLLLERGRLTQTCPSCGLSEAAGGYCTKCATPTGPGHWFRGEATDAQRAARAAKATESQSQPGKGSVWAETAKPEVLA